MGTLERAIAIAAAAHEGVTDKAGAPYILHPLRVMMRMDTDEERIVAVLHDVVEDSDWTFERLAAEGFSGSVIAALDSVTKSAHDEETPGEDAETKRRRYLGFIARAATNDIGRKVKIADLEDNLDLSRIASPTPSDLARCEKYRAALAFLRSSARASG